MRIIVQKFWETIFPALWETDLLFQWELTASLLILVVLIVRFFTRERLSCFNRYAMWAVVLIRLLIPFQLPFLSLPVTVDQLPNVVELAERPFEAHISAPDAPLPLSTTRCLIFPARR